MPTIQSFACGGCFAIAITGLLLRASAQPQCATIRLHCPKRQSTDRARLAEALGRRLHERQLRPRHLDLERRHGTLHRPAGRRDPHCKRPYANFELVAEWRHLKSGGNSGIFVWACPRSLKGAQARAACRTGSKCRCSTTATPSSTKSSPARRPIGSRPTATCFPLGCEDDALSAALSGRHAAFPARS